MKSDHNQLSSLDKLKNPKTNLFNLMDLHEFLQKSTDKGVKYHFTDIVQQLTDDLKKRLKVNISYSDDLYKETVTTYIGCFNIISKATNNEVITQNILVELVLYVFKMAQPMQVLLELQEKLPGSYFSTIAALSCEPHFILHKACEKTDDSFIYLVDLLKGVNFSRYNEQGESFFHCIPLSNVNYVNGELVPIKKNKLKKCFELYPDDINHRNHSGDTPLHAAAACDDITSTRFLIVKNADQAIKNNEGKIYLEVDGLGDNPALSMYLEFKRKGRVLDYPPEIKPQKSITCGFYAVSCATTFHYNKSPLLFKDKTLPARKKDKKKSHTSLRQYRAAAEIDGIGPIFSIKQMQKLIERNECTGIVIDIKDEKGFRLAIENAINNNVPLIIPYSVDPNNSPYPHPQPDHESSSSSAHWATIIGYNFDLDGCPLILLAQHGNYFQLDATSLFDAFYKIHHTFPETKVLKDDAKGWIFRKDIMNPDVNAREITIPETKLNDFRRKLLVVVPPGFNINLLNLENDHSTEKAPYNLK